MVLVEVCSNSSIAERSRVADARRVLGAGAQPGAGGLQAHARGVARLPVLKLDGQGPLDERDRLVVVAGGAGDDGGVPVGRHDGAWGAQRVGGVEQLGGELPGAQHVAALVVGHEQGGGQLDPLIGPGLAGVADQQLLAHLDGEVQLLALAVGPAQRDGHLQGALGGQLLLAQPQHDRDRLVEVSRGLRGQRQAELGFLTKRCQTCQVTVSQEFRETRAGLGDLAVLECQPRVAEGQLDVLHLLGGDPVDQIGQRAVQFRGQQLQDRRGGSTLAALDQRDVTVRQLGMCQLSLRKAALPPNRLDTESD
ncbi:hypothetical protein GCM10020001_079360 [Nonomuraea salmonea]